MPHLAHFSRGSINLGQTVARWSPPLQIWHPPNMVEEDDASGLGTFPLKKLISVLFKVATCFPSLFLKLPLLVPPLGVRMESHQALPTLSLALLQHPPVLQYL